jgi:hypothetical protein
VLLFCGDKKQEFGLWAAGATHVRAFAASRRQNKMSGRLNFFLKMTMK